MQSDRFYNALKGHGALCRLVILPFESHGYAARESVMHVLWESDRWLQKYCVENSSDVAEGLDTSKNTESKSATDAESKVGVAGGVPEQEPDDGRFDTARRSLLW